MNAGLFFWCGPVAALRHFATQMAYCVTGAQGENCCYELAKPVNSVVRTTLGDVWCMQVTERTIRCPINSGTPDHRIAVRAVMCGSPAPPSFSISRVS